jgi:hypothetical protein
MMRGDAIKVLKWPVLLNIFNVAAHDIAKGPVLADYASWAVTALLLGYVACAARSEFGQSVQASIGLALLFYWIDWATAVAGTFYLWDLPLLSAKRLQGLGGTIFAWIMFLPIAVAVAAVGVAISRIRKKGTGQITVNQ